MRTVSLGNSPLSVSRLGYGCWRLGQQWEGAELTAERRDVGRKAVLAAYEAGYTLFDHADIYSEGESERIFGEVLRSVSGMRERVVIASKCGIRRPGDPEPGSPYRYDLSAGHIVRACEGSLRRMGVEVIDLYQLHRPDYLADPDEVAQAFDQLKTQGKVREFGVSNFKTSHVSLLQRSCSMPLRAHQVELSLACLTHLNDGILDQCRAERMSPLAWSPLAGGRLASNEPIDLREPDHAHRLLVRESLDRLARERDTTRPIVALAWLLKHPCGILPLVGSTDPARIREFASADSTDLSREEWYRLTEAAFGCRLP